MSEVIAYPTRTAPTQSLFDLLDCALIGLDRNSHILQINQQATTLYHWEPQHILNKNFFDVCRQSDYGTVFNPQILLQQGPNVFSKTHEQAFDNTYIEWKIVTLPATSHVATWLIGNNITERKKIEKALQKAKAKAEAACIAKSQFISNLSHDLRTPLVGIIPMSQRLMDKEADPTKQKFLECIFSSSKALLNLLNNLINVANLETGEIKLEISIFSLSELITEVISFVSPSAEIRSLVLQPYIDSQVSDHWKTDRQKLFRILANLVGNAIKFTEQGSVKILVASHTYQVKIYVIDTGIGIPCDKHQIIFERLQCLTDSHESKNESSGLGLYEAKLFTEELGGTINVESKVGAGSTFTITFPLEKVIDS